METRKKPLSAWHYALGLFIMLALIALAGNPLGAAESSTVTLRAEKWNDGMVHVWHDLDERSERYTALPDGTRCARLDPRPRTVGSGSHALRYTLLSCPDVTGYVLWHQAR